MDLSLIISLGTLIGCFIALSWFAGTDAPYVPTKMGYISKVLKLAGVKKGKKFYELGSGDGRVVFAAAKLGANSTGIEQSLLRVLLSKYKAYKLASRLRGVDINFVHSDIFKKNYADADVIYIYLLNKGVAKLEPKLQHELKRGAMVITQTYHFPKWRPVEKLGDFRLYRR